MRPAAIQAAHGDTLPGHNGVYKTKELLLLVVGNGHGHQRPYQKLPSMSDQGKGSNPAITPTADAPDHGAEPENPC